MRKLLFALSFFLAGSLASAQEESVLKAAMYLSGASCEEEIPEEWIDRVEAAGKVRINDPHLKPSVFLSSYQVACINDYRGRAGDILSFGELALVDGFSEECVEALKPYLSLHSSRLPGSADTVRLHTTALLRSTLKKAGGKLKLSGDSWKAGGAWRSASYSPFFKGGDGTFHADVSGRFGRAVIGDFNLRYGQGLASWTGFSMSSLSTLDAFIWRSTGVSPVWSFNSSSVLRGAAYEYSWRRFSGSLFAAAQGVYGGHLDFLGRNGKIGGTVLWNGALTISADSRWNIKGAYYAAEVAWRGIGVPGSAAFKAAGRWKIREEVKLALQLRAVPSRFGERKNGEYAVAVGSSYTSGRWKSLAGRTGFGSSVPVHRASITADAALLPIPESEPYRFQLRIYAMWQWQMASAWNLDLRFTERYRNYENSRSSLRADLRYAFGPWLAVLRTEGVHCENIGGLAYLEGGHKSPVWSTYLRLTGFWIDAWNDRIYVYERDAPGTFSVPAYYGRGGALSMVGSFKHSFQRAARSRRRITLKANLRGAVCLRTTHEPAYTLNLQLQCDI